MKEGDDIRGVESLLHSYLSGRYMYVLLEAVAAITLGTSIAPSQRTRTYMDLSANMRYC